MVNKKVKIKTPFIKLDQLLKFAGVTGSGGEASYLISEGFICVDGVVEMQRGKKIRHGMTVECKIPETEDIQILVETLEG